MAELNRSCNTCKYNPVADVGQYPCNECRRDILSRYEAKVITRGNCMMCGKELTEGLFFCKECEAKAQKVRDKMDKRTMIETTLNTLTILHDYLVADEWGDDEIDEGVEADWQIEQVNKAHEIIETLLPEGRWSESEE